MKICSFCGAELPENQVLSAQKGAVRICANCVSAAHKIMMGWQQKREQAQEGMNFSPKGLKEILDSYVIGQEEAKKTFAIAVYNHYKRVFRQHEIEDESEIAKSNVLLIGPTGSGKTLMAQTLARYLNVPIALADATSLTEAGYVGEDVENILTKLLQNAGGDMKKAERGIVFIDEIDKIARLGENRSITRDVSGEGVQQTLLKIIEGSSVNVTQRGGRKHPHSDFVAMDTTNILFICGGAFDGLEDIVARRIGKNSLGFTQTQRGAKETRELIHQLESEDLIHYGLIPELIGRLHVISTLRELEVGDLMQILTTPKNALIKQYQKLFAIDGVKLTFTDDAIKAIAQQAIKRKTGARGLRTIIEKVARDLMYELPDLQDLEIVIGEESVNKGEKPLYIKMAAAKAEREKLSA
ncbi:MAG: ATP-dependent Clp protease ATP-binding subunit ClpX [Helicobacteraceae bacterium]|jgi:ATP-dependent Clp protease ATP-binding subunit ClpX|nr:ATP-dependent Clp protease ATP-binding subunit ClpX [Helicobacteraceae bacterium]